MYGTLFPFQRAERAEKRLDTDSLSMISFDSRRGEVAGENRSHFVSAFTRYIYITYTVTSL